LNFKAFPRNAKRGILKWIIGAKRPASREKRIEVGNRSTGGTETSARISGCEKSEIARHVPDNGETTMDKFTFETIDPLIDEIAECTD
jgi:hypothetical protein